MFFYISFSFVFISVWVLPVMLPMGFVKIEWKSENISEIRYIQLGVSNLYLYKNKRMDLQQKQPNKTVNLSTRVREGEIFFCCC